MRAQLENMACRGAFLSQNSVVGKVAKLDVIVFKAVFFFKMIVVTPAVIRCSLQWLECGKAGIVTFKLAH